MPNFENQRVLHFKFQCQKLLRLYHNTYILLFSKDLSGFMIYSNTSPVISKYVR